VTDIHPTAIVDPDAVLGERVRIGPFAVLHEGVTLDDDVVVDSHVVLGHPAADRFAGADRAVEPCRIGAGSVVRSHSVIYEGVTIGRDFQSGHHVCIRRGAVLGDDVAAAIGVDLQGEMTVGDHVRINSHCVIGRGTVLEDFVWMAGGIIIANDLHPPSDGCFDPVVVRRFAVITNHVKINPGVEVGEHAFIGGGALVVRDVRPWTVVFGIPATERGSVKDIVCKEGRLDQVYPWFLHFRRGYNAAGVAELERLAAEFR